VPPPATVPDVGFSPAQFPAQTLAGGSGGTSAGLTLSEVRGVCVAFDSATLEPAALWTRLDDPNGPFRVQSWSIKRGRSYELDRTGTGTATVAIADVNGDFDPTNAGSFFAGKLNPLKQAAIALQNPVTGAWSTVFRGFVEDFAYTLHPSKKVLFLELQLMDAFDLLAAVEVAPGTAGNTPMKAEQIGNVVYYRTESTVHYRLSQALADAKWPTALQTIFTGNVHARETVYAPRTSILSILQDAADAEFPGVANLYVSKDGKVTFHGRKARFNPTDPQYGIQTWKCGDGAAVQADSTVAQIRALSFGRSKTNIVNAALATPAEIPDTEIAGQIVTDLPSINTYGLRSWSAENLVTLSGNENPNLNANDETKLYASYYVNNYKDPQTRVNQVQFRSMLPSDSRASANWALICGIEIGDILNVKTTHPGGGGFNEDFYVEGISYDVSPATGIYHDVTLTLDVSPKAYYTTNPGL
jgi:hypothetical protein